MPFCTYLPDQMGSATITPSGPFVAGSYEELVLVYTAGAFGIDDSGMLKISWRTTSDLGKLQFDRPQAAGYTTIEASNGAELECRVDRINIRPWSFALAIRVGRGFLRAGDTITVRFGDRRRGSPGIRLQTNVESSFEFKVFVDAFATYEFTELPRSPEFALVPGPPHRWKAIAPSLVGCSEPFRLAIVAEDLWGNPTDRADATLVLKPSVPVAALPARVTVRPGAMTTVLEGLAVDQEGDVEILVEDEAGKDLARANPMRVVERPVIRRYWGDLHGQSEETVGTNSAAEYFAFARDRAFLDLVGHQGNDFQITDAFWAELNRLTAAYDVPHRFVAIPGYEWSGNTGMGGDRNVLYRHEGRPIHRSSHILVTQEQVSTEARTTAQDLFAAIAGEDVAVIAHVGGRYADIKYAHDPRLETAVEIHSTWGTFEWLLHDAFAKGHRVGVVSHSDDHKGRPGATWPGASSFGAIGGLTCYFMPELTRDALFAALRRRHHYGTTGARIFMSVDGAFERPVSLLEKDPLNGPGPSVETRACTMGDIVRPGSVPMRLDIEVIGTAPIERIDVFHGTVCADTIRPDAGADSQRIRVRWQGAEYRGRGRQTEWRGEITVVGNRIERALPVNFLNPERKVAATATTASWRTVTTGNMAGIDLWLADGRSGSVAVGTTVVDGRADLAQLGIGDLVFDGGGLGRCLMLYRLPEAGGPRQVRFSHQVAHAGDADLPVYVRVTQEDGHQAWSSPIYLIR